MLPVKEVGLEYSDFVAGFCLTQCSLPLQYVGHGVRPGDYSPGRRENFEPRHVSDHQWGQRYEAGAGSSRLSSSAALMLLTSLSCIHQYRIACGITV
jgi:hypothetical protein